MEALELLLEWYVGNGARGADGGMLYAEYAYQVLCTGFRIEINSRRGSRGSLLPLGGLSLVFFLRRKGDFLGGYKFTRG